MIVFDIIRILALLGFLGILAIYVAEAWQKSKVQAALCLFVPFYVFYFAFVKSSRSLPFRVALLVVAVLLCLPSSNDVAPAAPSSAAVSKTESG